MRILYLCPFLPYPLYNGTSIRNFNLIKELSSRHQVTVVSYRWPDGSQDCGPLESWGVKVQGVPQPGVNRLRPKALFRALSPDLRSFFARYSHPMAALVRHHQQAGTHDVLIAYGPFVGRYAAQSTGPAMVLDDPNLSPRLVEQQLSEQRGALRRLPVWIGWKQLCNFVSGVASRFDLCTVTSKQDRDAMRRALSRYAGPIELVPNGVDLSFYPLTPYPSSPFTLIFNGTLRDENFRGMKFFLEDIFPLVVKAEPRVELHITGFPPQEGASAGPLKLTDRVRFTGYLPDIKPNVGGSRVCVVPLLKAAGTRLKILEAMALGTPVVATSKAADGLEVTDGADILLADEPDAFARAVLSVIQDQALHDRLAANARRLVEEKYNWQTVARGLEELLARLVGGERPRA